MSIQELDVKSKPGFIIVSRASGPPAEYPLADILRAADIPTGLTYTQVQGLSVLANLVVILVRTLINRDVLDESFADDAGLSLSLDGLIEAIEGQGGAYHEPVIDGDEL